MSKKKATTKIVLKHFSELSTTELYEIIKLRIEVFCVEQNCAYQDADGKDQESLHLMLYNNEKKLIAYARLLPKGLSYAKYASIGRLLTCASVRKSGFGRLIMQKSMDELNALVPNTPIMISAQTYLLKFYKSFGFQSTGEEYLEDGIPHTQMVLEK